MQRFREEAIKKHNQQQTLAMDTQASSTSPPELDSEPGLADSDEEALQDYAADISYSE